MFISLEQHLFFVVEEQEEEYSMVRMLNLDAHDVHNYAGFSDLSLDAGRKLTSILELMDTFHPLLLTYIICWLYTMYTTKLRQFTPGYCGTLLEVQSTKC